MTTPIVEQIAENLKTAVNAITVAAGYNQTLSAVRPRKNDFSDVMPEDGKVLIVQADAERIDGEGYGTAQWTQRFVLMAIVLDDDTDTDSIDTRRNQVASDIEKKLMADPQRTTTGTKLAMDTRIVERVMFDDGEGFTGVAVGVAVSYRTQETDPYTKG